VSCAGFVDGGAQALPDVLLDVLMH